MVDRLRNHSSRVAGTAEIHHDLGAATVGDYHPRAGCLEISGDRSTDARCASGDKGRASGKLHDLLLPRPSIPDALVTFRHPKGECTCVTPLGEEVFSISYR